MGVREYVDRDAWVHAVQREAGDVDGPVVIPDVRFLNEADYVEDNGEVLRVERPGLNSTDGHVSENELNDYWIAPDRVIVNDGTLADLGGKVGAMVEDLRVFNPWAFTGSEHAYR